MIHATRSLQHGFGRLTAVLALGLGLLLATAPARAMPIYDFFFDSSSGPDLSFQLPAQPVPDSFNAIRFDVNNFAGTLGGTPSVLDGSFFLSVVSGGFSISDGSTTIGTFGTQLFSGPVDSPTFLPGSFSLSGAGGSGGTLTISAVDVPEPAGLALFAVGLACLRRARRRST